MILIAAMATKACSPRTTAASPPAADAVSVSQNICTLSGAISGKLIYVAVILPGFFQWLWNVAGIDTLSMQCSLHGWIPQLMTDSVYGSAWVSEDSVCWEWDNRKQRCVLLMEMRMHSGIMGVFQANTDTTDTLALALVLDLVFASSNKGRGWLASRCTSLRSAVCVNGYRGRRGAIYLPQWNTVNDVTPGNINCP